MSSGPIPASTALSETAPPRLAAVETCERLIARQLPNFFRLYLNPFVAQACFCLNRCVQAAWPEASAHGDYQTFLANGCDEALSGAIKLARYAACAAGRPAAGLIVDPHGRLRDFASLALASGDTIELIPELIFANGVASGCETAFRSGRRFGFVVLVDPLDAAGLADRQALAALAQREAPSIVACLDRERWTELREGGDDRARNFTPDIVVFDESFANREVPFGAFAAHKGLYDNWNRRNMAAFHSTTFQPNAISSLHFLRRLEQDDPRFFAGVAADLERIGSDRQYRKSLFRRLYNPSLASLIATLGFDRCETRASGHYVFLGERRIFDGVAGVACSVRGHNPLGFVAEIERQDEDEDVHETLQSRLRALTGLSCLTPAVSGASAVENALKIALAAQFPKRHVLALQGGFGGKTLFALTGVSKEAYKSKLSPLYEHVTYVDPFSPRAIDELADAFDRREIAVVLMELIQGVGGVRPIPEPVVDFLDAQRRRSDCLLLVDEVQTGVYRTGPFTRSQEIGLAPDLLTLGKGVSDMIFPYSLTLHSDAVERRLDEAARQLRPAMMAKYGYELGYRTVLNTLDNAQELDLEGRVRQSGELFAKLLREELASCPAIREVRVFGLLIGIELNVADGPRKWLKKILPRLMLLAMMRHRSFPLVLGFCQYEPHILKLTPPLTITPEEIRLVCRTITHVLKMPPAKLAAAGLSQLASRRPRSSSQPS